MKKILVLAITTLLLTACQKSTDPKSNVNNGQTALSTTTMDHNSMAGMDHSKMTHSNMKHQDMSSASMPVSTSSESVYQVGGNWKDQTDKPFDLNALLGQKQIVAFIYTSCQEVCPIMMKTLKDIQAKLPVNTQAKTGILVISLDPKRDSPQVLAKFAEHYKADKHWHFLSSNDDDIRMLANTMNIRYQFAEDGMINHSNVLSVLDENGKMIEQTIGNSQGEDKIIAAVNK